MLYRLFAELFPDRKVGRLLYSHASNLKGFAYFEPFVSGELRL